MSPFLGEVFFEKITCVLVCGVFYCFCCLFVLGVFLFFLKIKQTSV